MNDESRNESSPKQDRLHELLREAWAAHREGNLTKARRTYRRALDIEPENPDANNLLGLLWLQSGKPADAVPLIRKALQTQPDSSQSHFNLGLAYAELGQLPEARKQFIETVELQPDHLEALINLGNTTRLLGMLDESDRAFRRALELQPDHVEAMCSVGFVELARQNYEQAEQVFAQALNQQPAHPRSLSGYGEALMGQRRYQDAVQWLRKAIREAPKSAALHNDLGAVYNRLGQAKAAVEHFSQALRIDPMHAQARINLGLTLEQFGYLEDAEHAYSDTIRSAPGFADAHFRLAHLHTHRSTPQEIDMLRTLLDNESTPLPARIQLAFGLGHALDKAGEYEEAFRYMTEGHRLRARANPFSLEDAVQAFSTLRTWFDPRRIKALRDGGVPDERPVLIIGMPRSGTTLVEQILASHPLVHGAGESGLLGVAVANLAKELKQPYPEGLDALPAQTLRREAQAYIEALEKEAGSAQRIVDTSPMNFLQIGLAAALLPDARFIHVRRDPLDTCLSIYREMLGDMHSYAHDLHDLGAFYQLYEQMMEHWAEVLGPRMHEVVYEKLIEDPQRQIRRLLDFCGIPNNPACQAFHETERMVRTPAAAQVRQPFYKTSIGAWRHYEKQLKPLRQILRPGDQG